MKRLGLTFSLLILAVIMHAQIPTDGLVAYYPFNGNANDETGNGHNGTVYGATLTEDRFGNQNSAYSFNGVNNRIFLGNSLLIEGYNISISCWYKVDVGGTVISTGNRNSYRIGSQTDAMGGMLYVSGDTHGSYVETTFAESYEWTHVVMTYDGTNHKLYRNGELVDNQISDGAVFSDQSVYLNIGVYQYFGSNFSGWFSGLIDDVRLYNQTITDDEIQALYHDGGFPTVTDIDGNTYKTVKIGNQVWMAENLKTITYNDGTSIELVENNTDWENNTIGAYCWYDNDEVTYADTYGALYNWHAVNTGNLCPSGWHVPTDEEWTTLTEYLGGASVAGGKLKATGTIEAGTGLWYDPNTGATNKTGFTALPGGNRSNYGGFQIIGYNGDWWSATEYGVTTSALTHYLYYLKSDLVRSFMTKEKGLSVRCVKDEGTDSLSSSSIEIDSLALVALYNSTDGDNWTNNTNWLTGPVYSWFGITVENYRVTQISLDNNNLSGTIPSELGNLTNLEYLSLRSNQLEGSIPPELGSLINLQSLYLNGNQLEGSIPPALGNLTNLQWLNLQNNHQLEGSIPPELGNLINLVYLSFYNNQLVGSIPPELGNLSNLQYLYINANQLEGSIPPELGNLSNLQYLYINENQLEGSIPSELGSLINLQELYLSYNQLEGSIPSELGSLTNLQRLRLGNNHLEGSIPAELENLTNLELISLYENQLEGSIPSELGNLTNLQHLDFSNNQLAGSIPSELGNLTNLEYLSFHNNQLEGSIPPELGNLTNLRRLRLYSNQLEGSIPSELGNLTNLQELIISYNQLADSIPAELGNLTNLQILYLNSNQLEGSIPAELGNLSNLQYLYINENQLEGSIPSELGSLINLQQLYLYSNQLEGSIPAELGNLINLERLSLQNNQLEGSIPPELGNLTNLQNLYLYSNQFEELPDLSGLNSLANCFIDKNYFTFGDLESASIDWNALSGYSYAPQEFLPLDVDTTSNNVTLTVLAENPNNNYQWFKDGDTLTNETDSIFTYVESDESSYYCKITNNEFPDLTLQTIPFGANIQNGILDNDYNALVALYNNTDGDHWNNNSNWLSDEPAGKWNGVTVEGLRVTEINLLNNNLSGTIPTEIGDLDSLKLLYIYHNNGITGSIPVEIGNLKALTRLILAGEKLTGSIPVELSNLTKLEFLSLFSNELEGSIPAELGNLTNLEVISLRNNQLIGSIPAELGNLTNLQSLYLYNNQFEELPDLSGLNNLSHCYIYNNHFTFGDLENTGLIFSEIDNVRYAPQDTLALAFQDSTIIEGTVFSINFQDLTIETLTSVNNLYAVYKDDVLVKDWSTDMEYVIPSVASGDAGKYTIQVSNSNYPDLILVTDTLQINVNHYPTDIQLSNNTIDENQPVGSTVGELTAADQDVGDTHTFALIGGNGSNDADNSSFTIEGNTLKTTEVFDYESQSTYNIYIQAEDASGATFEKAFVINAIDQNESPTNIELSNNTIDENKSIGSTVGVLTAADQDIGDTHTFAFISGDGSNDADNSSFTIEGNLLKTNEIFDYETQQEYHVFIQTEDQEGIAYTKELLISIIDVNESPTRIELSNYTVEENQPVGTAVGELTAIDEDVNDTHVFTINGSSSNFIIENHILKTNEILDYESEKHYTLKIEVEDAAGNSYKSYFGITVLNTNDNPTDIMLSNNTINENQPIETDVGLLTTVDQDKYDYHEYILISGNGTNDADNSSFYIEENILKTNEIFDYEIKPEKRIYVQTIDLEGGTYEKAFTIQVNNATGTGFENVSEEYILVYPNPAKDYLIINTGEYEKLKNYLIYIIDISGNTVFETKVSDPLYKINVSAWNGKGLYLMHLYDDSGKLIIVKKIILQ